MNKHKPLIHQLANFKIDEVSLVDRGANRQRFVVIKRRADMPDNAQQPESATNGAEPQHQPPPEEDASGERDKPESVPNTPLGPDAKEAQTTPNLAALPDMLVLLRDLVATLNIEGQKARADSPEDSSSTDGKAAVTKIEKRLERLEKHFCLPNSMASEEAHSADEGHVWPFDLNANRGKA